MGFFLGNSLGMAHLELFEHLERQQLLPEVVAALDDDGEEAPGWEVSVGRRFPDSPEGKMGKMGSFRGLQAGKSSGNARAPSQASSELRILSWNLFHQDTDETTQNSSILGVFPLFPGGIWSWNSNGFIPGEAKPFGPQICLKIPAEPRIRANPWIWAGPRLIPR